MTISTPDEDGAGRLSTFYEAMASMDVTGIVLGDGVSVIYRDEYKYINKIGIARFCLKECDSILDRYSLVHGEYSKRHNRITLFRGAVEIEIEVGVKFMPNGGATISSGGGTRSGVETAIKTLGHEAAHSRGIDMHLPGNAYHPNAEAEGLRALEMYRKSRAGR